MPNSILGGTMIRVGANTWSWADGEPEPCVTDLSPSARYNFRCRGGEYVEVLLSACMREPDVLGWVMDGYRAGRYGESLSGDHTGPRVVSGEDVRPSRIDPGEDPLCGNEPVTHRRAIPRVALVPISEWDAWARDNPYGATWPRAQEERIFAKARSLGWRQ